MLMQRHGLTTIPHRLDAADKRTRERLEDDQSEDRDDVWIDEAAPPKRDPRSGQFRSAPRTGGPFARQAPDASNRLRPAVPPAMIGGGTWEGAHARHEAAGVHQPARRRGGGVAARRARAAGGEAADHRVLGCEYAFRPEPMDRRFCAAAARTRLDRGPDCRDRVSLGGGTQPSASPRSPPNSSGSRSMSLSRTQPQTSSRQSRRRRSSRSCSRRWRTRSAWASSRVWRDRVATSPACRTSSPISPASELELLREVVPGLRRLAILANVGCRQRRAGDGRG